MNLQGSSQGLQAKLDKNYERLFLSKFTGRQYNNNNKKKKRIKLIKFV